MDSSPIALFQPQIDCSKVWQMTVKKLLDRPSIYQLQAPAWAFLSSKDSSESRFLQRSCLMTSFSCGIHIAWSWFMVVRPSTCMPQFEPSTDMIIIVISAYVRTPSEQQNHSLPGQSLSLLRNCNSWVNAVIQIQNLFQIHGMPGPITSMTSMDTDKSLHNHMEFG